jgi:hypothetical protein
MKRHLRRDKDRHAPECVALIRAQPMTTTDPSSNKENTADGGSLAGGLSVSIFAGTGNTMAAPNGKYHPFMFSRPGRKVKTLIQYAASEPISQAGIKANFASPGQAAGGQERNSGEDEEAKTAVGTVSKKTFKSSQKLPIPWIVTKVKNTMDISVCVRTK